MKKLVAVMLAGVMIVGLMACGTEETLTPAAEEPVVEEAVVAEPEATTPEASEVAEEPVAEGRTIEPLPISYDIADLEDGIYWVDLDMSTYTAVDDGYKVSAEVFVEEYYDAVDVTTMVPGDTLVVDGVSYVVETISTNDYGTMDINGGLEEGGTSLSPSTSGGTFQFRGFDDITTYADLGTTELTISHDAVVTDLTDFEFGEIKWVLDDLPDRDPNLPMTHRNTTVRLENGVVVEMNMYFVP